MNRDPALRLGYLTARTAGMSHAGAVLSTGQGWTESNLGMGGQFLLPSGPTNNWGATTAKKGVPSFGGGDRAADGTLIAQRWAGPFPSLGAGFAYWRELSSVERAWPAYQAGDEVAVARILYAGGYYEGVGASTDERIANYVGMLRGGRSMVEQALRGSGTRALLVGGAVGLGLVLVRSLNPRWG